MASTDRPESEDPARSLTTILFLAVLIVAWGGNYTWVKLALADSGPWTFNAFRYGLAALFLGGVLWAARGASALMPVQGERWPMALVGFLQISVMTGGTTLALARVEASRTVLIAYSMPIWGMLLSFFLLRERATPAMILGTVLGLVGLSLLCAPWAMDWSSASAIEGSAMAFAGTLAWALGAVIYRMRRWRSGFWPQVFWQILTGAATMIAGMLLLEHRPLTPSASYGVIVLYNALVPTVLGFWCWARALDRIPVPTASQVLMLSPIFGVLLSAAVLDEPLTLTLLASGLLIVTGAVLSYARPAMPTGRS